MQLGFNAANSAPQIPASNPRLDGCPSGSGPFDSTDTAMDFQEMNWLWDASFPSLLPLDLDSIPAHMTTLD